MQAKITKNIEQITAKLQESLAMFNISYAATSEQKRSRGLEDINIVAISKQQNLEKITAALDAGHRLFGENKIQEANQKWPSLKRLYTDIKLHLVGPLQTNKVKDAVRLFDVIETLDRKKLADELVKQMVKSEKNIECFIQINVGNEKQKAGIALEEADEFIKYCKNIGINVTGLMCIPPVNEFPAPYFALLATIAKRNKIENLSMGMSADYDIAVSLGANYIRLGTVFFGERERV